MKRWFLALLLVLLCIAAAVLPLMGSLFESSPERVGLPNSDLPFYVKTAADRTSDEAGYVPGEVLVKLKLGVSEAQAASVRSGQGVEEVYISPFSSVRRWKVPPAMSVDEWIQVLGKNPLVEYAEPNYYAYASMVPNDPGFGYQWHLDNAVYGGIHAKAAWDMVTGSPRVVVAVVDTGVAYEDNVAPSNWHIDTYQAYSGSGHSWWCGVSAAPYSWTTLYGSYSTPPGYGNGWLEYLQHAFNLGSATGTVTFSYQYRHDLEVTTGTARDKAFTEISTDGGDSWTILRTYTGKSRSSPTNNWKADSIDLSSYAGDNVLIRFRVYSDEQNSDEDGVFNSDGAFFVDEIKLTDQNGAHTIFTDNAESGAGTWVTTAYEQAPDLAGTSFWVNVDEIAGNGLDDDGNGLVDDLRGWDFVNDDAHPNDDGAHGTHVSGTVAQTTLNGFGVAGVAFGVTIMPVKVLDSGGAGSWETVADGIYYAADNGADIISLSLGGSAGDTTLQNAVKHAYELGVTVIAASGNNNGAVGYPAAYDAYVIAVGATQYNEARAPYSNYGTSLDLVAPGGNTGVDLNGDGYADGVLQNTFGDTPTDWAFWFYQGTSMATPHVSGLAALILARNPSLTPDGVRNILQSTADDLGTAGRDNYFGWGLINAEKALKSMAEPVHLMLAAEPIQASYARGQTLTLTVSVFNEMNPAFNSSLSLTVTGPEGYYHYDFQPIAIAADEVKDYSFSWAIPQTAGTYVAEVGLVPAQLTAYDAAWLKAT